MSNKLQLDIDVKAGQSSRAAFAMLRKGFQDLAKETQKTANALLKMGNTEAAKAVGHMSMGINRVAAAMADGGKGIDKYNKSLSATSKAQKQFSSDIKASADAFQYYSVKLGDTKAGQAKAAKAAKNVEKAVTGMAEKLKVAGVGVKNYGQKVKWSNIQQALQNGHLKIAGGQFEILSKQGAKALGISNRRLMALGELNKQETLYSKVVRTSINETGRYQKAVETLGKNVGKTKEKVELWEPALRKANKSLNSAALRNMNQQMDNSNRSYGQMIGAANRASVVQQVLAGNIKLTADGFKILNSQGLAPFKGLSEQAALNMGLLDKSFAKQLQGTGQITKKMSLFRKEMAASTNRSKSFQQALIQGARTYGRNSLEFANYAKAIRKLDDEYRKMTASQQQAGTITANEQKKLNAAFDVTSRTSQNVVKNYKTLEKAIDQYGKASGRSRTEIDNWVAQMQNAGKSQQQVVTSLNSASLSSQRRWEATKKAYAGYGDVVSRVNDKVKSGKLSYDQASAGLERFHKAMVQAGKGLTTTNKALSYVGNKFKSFAAYTVAAGSVAAFIRTMMVATSTILEHDQALQDLQAITGATADEIIRMDETIKQVAATTKFSAGEVAEGMKIIGQSGFSASESISTIQAVSDLATGTLTSLATSADLVTSTLRVFKKDTAESGRVADIFTNAVNNSKLTIDKLKIAMNYMGPIAARAGVSFEDTAASMMILANSGLRASSIATGLRRVIKELVEPSKKMRDAITDAGFAVEDLNPQVHSMRTVISRLGRIVKGADEAFRLFGLRGATAVSALVTQGVPAFDKMSNAIKKQGTASKNAEIQMKGLSVSYKNMADKLKNLALALGDAGVEDILRIFVDGARAVIDVFTVMVEHPILQWIVKLGVAATAAIGAVMLWPLALKHLIPILTSFTGAIVTLKTALLALAANPMTLLAAAGLAVGVAFVSMLKSIDSVIMAQGKLSEDAEKTVAQLDEEIKKIENFNGAAKDKMAMLDSLAKAYPNYAEKIYATNGNTEELIVTLQKLQEEQKKIQFESAKKELDALGDKVFGLKNELSLKGEGISGLIAGLFGGGSDAYKSELKGLEDELNTTIGIIQQKMIEMQEAGHDINVGEFFKSNEILGVSEEDTKKIVAGIEKVLASRKKLLGLKRPDTDIGIFSAWRTDLEEIPSQMKNVEKVLSAYDTHLDRTAEGSIRWTEANLELKDTMNGLVAQGGPLASSAKKVADSIDAFGVKSAKADTHLASFRDNVKNIGLHALAQKMDKTAQSQAVLNEKTAIWNQRAGATKGGFLEFIGIHGKAAEVQEEYSTKLEASNLAMANMAKEVAAVAMGMDGFSLSTPNKEFANFVSALGMTEQSTATITSLVISEIEAMRAEAGKPIVFGSTQHNQVNSQIAELHASMSAYKKQIEDIEKHWKATIKPTEDAFKALSEAAKTSIATIKQSFSSGDVFREFEAQVFDANSNMLLTEQERAEKINAIRTDQMHATARILEEGLSKASAVLDTEYSKHLEYIEATVLDEEEAKDATILAAREVAEKKAELYQQASSTLKGELDKALTIYQQYANKVKSLEQSIKDVRKSSTDLLRDLERKGMTEVEAYYDKRREISEKLIELKKLEGDGSDEAIQRTKQLVSEINSLANETARAVNKEISVRDRKTGKLKKEKQEIISLDRALAKSQESVRIASAQADKNLSAALEQQKENARNAKENMEALETKFKDLQRAAEEFATSFRDSVDTALATSVEAFNKQLDNLRENSAKPIYLELKTKYAEADFKVKELQKTLDALKKPVPIEIDTTGVAAAQRPVEDVKDALEGLDSFSAEPSVTSPSAKKVETLFEKLADFVFPPKVIEVTYKSKEGGQGFNQGGQVPGFNSGGQVPGFSSGGRVPGLDSGKGDTVRAMLTPEEFVEPVSAVRKYGVAFFEALRRKAIPKEAIDSLMNRSQRYAKGGLVVTKPMQPVFKFNSPNTSQRGMEQRLSENFGTLTLAVEGNEFPVQAPVDVLKDLGKAIRRQKLSRSN